jgi:hypothetical protein
VMRMLDNSRRGRRRVLLVGVEVIIRRHDGQQALSVVSRSELCYCMLVRVEKLGCFKVWHQLCGIKSGAVEHTITTTNRGDFWSRLV